MTFVRNAFVDDPKRQCDGKTAFANKQVAKATARRHGRQRSLRAYRCPHCAGWHLGKRP